MKKILSIILSITMLFSMTAVAFAEETTTSGVREVEGIIKVGTCADFAPFEYMENDKMLGFDIELMNYIAARINYGVEFVNMPFDKLIPAVISGEVDCAISGITITEQRSEVIDFTRPYLEAKVTYNGEECIEKYGIVFPLNSINKARLIEASGDPFYSKFILVNNAISSLNKDGTILKLIEKYELNSGLNNDKGNITTYSSIVTTEDTQSAGRPADGVLEENIPRYETWEEIGLTNPLPSEWAAKEIDYAYAVGITEINKDYHFRENITREEFCELIYNLIVLTSDEITAPITDSFTDTKNDKILMLNGLGIINGKSATKFAPNDYLTREEAATIIDRIVEKGYAKINTGTTAQWITFSDEKEISDWALFSVQNIFKMGIMTGVGNNNFAPKDNYTTEQAIVTLARVFKNTAVAKGIDHNSSIGIIGGTDGPTSIIVGDNTINVDKKQEYDNFYVEVKKNTKKVDDFYIDEAIKLTTESGTLASDKDFISYYTSNKDTRKKVLAIGAAQYSKPTEVYYIAANREQIINNIKALSGEESDGFDIEKLLKLNKVDFAVIGNMINASYGADNLAALTILTNSRGYVMPKDFTDDFAIYLQYDGEYSALVSFSKFGDGVIKATMSFVNNGERDNIFRRIYEITQGLGEDSIDVAVVR